MARVHRIGQRKTVHVYRLVTEVKTINDCVATNRTSCLLTKIFRLWYLGHG